VSTNPGLDTVAVRARDWHHRSKHVVCDVVEPWAHGTVARATRYPTYYDYNVVVVADDPDLGVPELIAFADQSLHGLGHRRLDFDLAVAADARAAELVGAGWDAYPRVVMRYEGPTPSAQAGIAAIEYDDAEHLRVAWLNEDHPDLDLGAYPAAAREVALRLGTHVLGVRDDDGRAIAFAEVQRAGPSAEVTRVYVDAAHRGSGLGTTLTLAAIGAAGDADDIWILADADARPRHLYARLGFTPVWDLTKFQRILA
jgi:GNAT superfamily N-acetyltransferase